MKKPIHLLLGLLCSFLSIVNINSQCSLDANSIVCPFEKMSISYSTEETYSFVTVNAFNQTGNMNIPALIENKTDTTAEIIFLEPGNAEIVIRYYHEGSIIAICNQNVIVFGDEPIPALGMVGDFLGDQVACESIDIDFNILLNCPDCTQSWTINGEPADLTQETFSIGNAQSITTNLAIDSLGEYTLCQTVLKADSLCYIEDCVLINIVEITEAPSFEIIDEEELTYCLGSEIEFKNLTEVEENITYHWSISYDNLLWNYYSEDLDFTFDLPGEYVINLEYTLTSNTNCRSPLVSKSINISDSPTLLISCDGQLCFENEITYRAPINCTDYEWVVDPAYGTIINQKDSIITIKWNEVTNYTETKVILHLNNCEQDVCQEISRSVELFPSEITIEGTANICESEIFTYSADYIPGATYFWDIELVESISGLSPKIISVQENNVSVEIFSFVGEFTLMVNATIEDRGCEVSTSKTIKRFNFTHSDNLCKEDLFIAELFPKIDEDVIWTVTNNDGSFFKQEIKSGLNSFTAFGFPAGGIYSVTTSIPSLDFACESGLTFEVINVPEIILSGPLSICEGDDAEYTLLGLGPNDVVVWEVFQNGMFTNITAQNINVTWLEGGTPYLIRVTRSTEASPGQVCESDDLLFTINVTDSDSLTITGEEIVCYDAISTYQMSIPGDYIWTITPPYMGTVIEGDSTENITVQWHYAPDIESATLSYNTEICDELILGELKVTFAPFEPIINLPDSICQGTRLEIKIDNLINYDIIEYYIDGELKADNRSSYTHTFNELGWVDIQIKVLNPNDCPGLLDITVPIFVKVNPDFEFEFSEPIRQCPLDSFETVLVTPSILSEQYYYQWILDGDTIKEGFGNIKLYSCLITQEMIINNEQLQLNLIAPNSCSRIKDISLNYSCVEIEPVCECKEDVVGSIDYITMHECSLISFAGSLDFSTIVAAEWQINHGDSITIIPINSPADLIQDSILLKEGILGGILSINVSCDGQLEYEDGSIEDAICNFTFVRENFSLFSPSIRSSYVCNENLNYDITLTNIAHSVYPSDSFFVAWTINNVDYVGESVELLDILANSDIPISITQCTIDSSYCCTNDFVYKSPLPFNPQIELPNGSCENDLWLFTVDINPISIQSILWDFGDGSGSTLANTEKGFDNTNEQTISVIVTNDRGCTAYDTIMVESFENLIDGEIDFTSAPCDSEAPLTYIENSSSEIVSYEWSAIGAIDTSSIVVTESGNYTVTVTDNHGCTDEALVNSIIINESFNGGIFVPDENCGFTTAFISENNDFTYTWYVNGDSTSTGGNISISEAGQFELVVVSNQISTNSVCDSMSKTITIYPRPELPNITIDKTYCDPLIAELIVNNYQEVTWTGVGINETAQVFSTSSPGLYSASHTDENGCTSTTPLNIEDNNVDFDYLADLCIQACREDLDSLQILIPGNGSSFDSWIWSSIDSNGLEYTISTSSGTVPSLLVTDEMYDYLELIINVDDCSYSSGLIPLDIIQCIIEEEEILCDTIDIFSSNCGHNIYECVVSEENGGPKYYYEGHITTTMPAYLCSDSLIATMSNGQIDILSFESLINPDGTLHIDYTANIFIDNVQEFEDLPTYIHFDFCDALDIETYCIDYILPYRSCTVDFECLTDYIGISQGTDEYVNVKYCINLSDVIQDDCTLETYFMTLSMTNDLESKIVFEEVISGDYDQLYCLDIPISVQDFTSGEFECLEMIVEGDCPGILCYNYQCGIFSPISAVNGSITSERKTSTRQSFNNISSTNPELRIFPNPSRGELTISYSDVQLGDKFVIKSALGKMVQNGFLKTETLSVELSNHSNGLYFISIERYGEVIESRKVFLVE